MADVMEDKEKKKETTIKILKKLILLLNLISYENFKIKEKINEQND